MAQCRIYLDVCALCRPFDDQSFVRIRLESDAVQLILQHVREGTFYLVCSPVHQREIAAISEMFERMELLSILSELGHPVVLIDYGAAHALGQNILCSVVLESQMLLICHSLKQRRHTLLPVMIAFFVNVVM